MIPKNYISQPAYNTLMEYLRYEIPRALSERSPLEERWVKYHYGYRALPETIQKDFPFIGAANLVLPIIATDVDTVFARLMGILFTPDNFWSCKPLSEYMVDYAPRLQEFLQWAQDAELNLYPTVGDFTLDLCKLGTGVVKTRYTREQKTVYQFRETDAGVYEQIQKIMLKDHPIVDHVHLPDFLLPAASWDIQLAPWASERLRLTWGQLSNRFASGLYEGGDRLARWFAQDRGSRVAIEMQNLDAFKPAFGDMFDLWESWLDFDITGSGEPMAIVVTQHLPTNTCLRVDFNPFFNQEKPFDAARYIKQEKRFYGIGLCEMLDQFQDEISTMHNQRLDNATLANSTMFWALRGQNIRENEPVIPGRWFIVDRKDAIGTLPMGQRYDSTVPYENLTLSYAAKRTGVSDYISASDNPAIGYGTATTAVQMLREGSKRFDQILRECRRCWGSVGTKVVELYQQYNQHGKEYMALGLKDGAKVHEILQFPTELIRAAVGVELTATSAQLNKEVEIRTNQIILGMVLQFYQQIMQAMMILANPQVPPPVQMIAQQMVTGGATLMRRIMDAYDVQDVDKIIPDLSEALGNGQQLNSLQGAYSAGAFGPPQFAGAPGMGNPGQGPFGAPNPGLQFSPNGNGNQLALYAGR